MKIKSKVLFGPFVVSVMLAMFAVEIALQKYIGILSYYDEAITLLAMLYMLFLLLTNGLSKESKVGLALMVLLLIIGLLGNYSYMIQHNWKAIVMDIGNMFKVFVTFFASCEFFRRYKRGRDVINYLNTICKFLVVPGVVLACINLMTDIGMHTEYVYGIRAFHYIFSRVGNLNAVAVACTTVMTMALTTVKSTKKEKRKQLIYVAMSILLDISTLRSRAFIFAIIYIVAYFAMKNRDRIKIKWRYVIGVGVAGIYIAYPKLIFYFSEASKAARGVLLRNGIKTALTYFPLGAGFGTYGTYAASAYRSPLYKKYKFDKYYGMSKESSSFLTDDYWPAIIGEFGFIGLIIMFILVMYIYRIILVSTKNKTMYGLAALYGMTTVTIASTVSSSFFNPTSVMILSVVGLAVGTAKYETNQLKKIKKKKEANSNENIDSKANTK